MEAFNRDAVSEKTITTVVYLFMPSKYFFEANILFKWQNRILFPFSKRFQLTHRNPTSNVTSALTVIFLVKSHTETYPANIS